MANVNDLVMLQKLLNLQKHKKKFFGSKEVKAFDVETNNSLAKLKIGRNEPCPCGSGLKFKKCCISHHRQDNGFILQTELQKEEEKIKEINKAIKESKGIENDNTGI